MSSCCALGSVIVGGVGNGTSGGAFDTSTCILSGVVTCYNMASMSFIGGGFSNINRSLYGFIGGGTVNNITTGTDNVIVGGQNNTVSGRDRKSVV